MEENLQQTAQPTMQGGQTTVVVNQTASKSNGLGTAGFVLAIICLFLFWIPVFDWILWALGLIFSFVGVFKKPRGLAIAGLVISLIGLVLIIAVAGVIAAAIGFAK